MNIRVFEKEKKTFFLFKMHTRVIKLFCVHAISMKLGQEYHLMIKKAYVKFQTSIVVSEKEAPH